MAGTRLPSDYWTFALFGRGIPCRPAASIAMSGRRSQAAADAVSSRTARIDRRRRDHAARHRAAAPPSRLAPLDLQRPLRRSASCVRRRIWNTAACSCLWGGGVSRAVRSLACRCAVASAASPEPAPASEPRKLWLAPRDDRSANSWRAGRLTETRIAMPAAATAATGTTDRYGAEDTHSSAKPQLENADTEALHCALSFHSSSPARSGGKPRNRARLVLTRHSPYGFFGGPWKALA